MSQSLRKSRSKPIEAVTLTCGFCGGAFTPRRSDSEYCQNACKIAAFNERAHEGRVVSARRVTSGEWSVVIRLKHDIGLASGKKVRIG